MVTCEHRVTGETSNTELRGDHPLVSVVIPTYNYAAYVGQAIESVLMQDYEPKQIIVTDDESTDNTAEILAAYKGRIEVLHLAHGGPGAARNAGLRAATGELIALLDADDLWLAGKLSQQVKVMQQTPQAGLSHSLIEPFDENGIYEPWVPDKDELAHGNCSEKIFRVNSIATSTVIMRREAIPQHGFYEDMPTSQDYALWLDVLFGYPAVFIPQVLARYRGHPGQVTSNMRKRWPIYQGLARLRILDQQPDQIDSANRQTLRSWALDQLHQSAYDRYWRGDYKWAAIGFSFLRRYGREIPARHRLLAAIRRWLPKQGPPLANEGNAMGSHTPQ